jgi:hypothetical protein
METKVSIRVDASKVDYLNQLSKMNPETLKILSDFSKRPGIETKLKEKQGFLKMFI